MYYVRCFQVLEKCTDTKKIYFFCFNYGNRSELPAFGFFFLCVRLNQNLLSNFIGFVFIWSRNVRSLLKFSVTVERANLFDISIWGKKEKVKNAHKMVRFSIKIYYRHHLVAWILDVDMTNFLSTKLKYWFCLGRFLIFIFLAIRDGKRCALSKVTQEIRLKNWI